MIMRSLLYPEAINNSFIMMFTKPEDGSISRKVQRLAKYRFLKKQSDLLLNADDLDAMWVCLRENCVIMMTPLIMAVKKNIEDVQGKDNYPCGQQLLIHNGKVLSKHPSSKRQLVASGILSELFENNIHQGPKTARVQARAALCAFSEGDKNAATELNALIQKKVFKGLYENASNTGHVGAHLAMLAAIRDVSKLVFKELTSWVIYSDEDRKFYKDITNTNMKIIGSRLCWPTVIENLDHGGFYIQDETAFSLLISCYRHASQDPFPLAAVCGNVWRNTEGQLSFLKYVISAAPGVFTFAHCKRQLV
ncbi:CCR4-NOT transcription complex subunit 1 [Tanacetum coccineum]